MCSFEQYYRKCHGVVYVIDGSDATRLEESRIAFGVFLFLFVFVYTTENMVENPQLSGVPILILANKQDVPVCACV